MTYRSAVDLSASPPHDDGQPGDRMTERLRFLKLPAALPPFFLIFALSTVFLFANDRGHFYRDGHHDFITAHHLAIAANLSPEHNFLLFQARSLDGNGRTLYKTYASWPIGSYALVKLAMLPFHDDSLKAIYAARIVQLFLFAGCAAMAYLTLARLTGDVWIALTATLLAFSSYYALYYNDAFAPEAMPGLFGVMLTAHGMVIFRQERRFRQLLIKACVALLLCWQVYALLLPFIAFGLMSELVKSRALPPPPPPHYVNLRAAWRALRFNRYLILGAATLAFGAAFLFSNAANEYFSYSRQISLTELPTVDSLTKRLGANVEFNAHAAEILEWRNFLQVQLYRIGRLSLPFQISPFDNYRIYEARDYLSVVIGILATGVCLVGLAFARHKMLWATLVVAGFCWSLPMRNFTAFHDFQALYYIGVPLTACSFLMLYIKRLSGPWLCSTLAVAVLLLFVFSSAAMAGVGHDDREAAADAEMMQDFAKIRSIVGDGLVHIPTHRRDPAFGGAPMASTYLLAGRAVQFYDDNVQREAMGLEVAVPDYAIFRWPDVVGPALLTPDNRRMFLYDGTADYDEKTLGSPIIASDWNVYLRDNTLIYVSEEFLHRDAAFFLHITPAASNDLPASRKKYSFDNLDFTAPDFPIRIGSKYVIARPLPEYDFAAIRTGQYTDEGRIWEGEYRIAGQ